MIADLAHSLTLISKKGSVCRGFAATGLVKTILLLYGTRFRQTCSNNPMTSTKLPKLPKNLENPENAAPAADGSSDAPAIRCPAWLKSVLLVALLIHFLGVLSEPLRFFSRSEFKTGPEFAWLGETMKPYSQWLYMNHGYFFFAPNPGPSHLIQCSLSSGSETEPSENEPIQTLFLPDRNEHWPRLLYHRYFMLSEFYSSRYAPRQVTEELKKDLEFMTQWAFDKEIYDQIQSSIVNSLKHSRGKEKVQLRRVERSLPESHEVLREGWSLNDPRLTTVLPESMIESAATVPVNELPSKPSAGISR